MYWSGICILTRDDLNVIVIHDADRLIDAPVRPEIHAGPTVAVWAVNGRQFSRQPCRLLPVQRNINAGFRSILRPVNAYRKVCPFPDPGSSNNGFLNIRFFCDSIVIPISNSKTFILVPVNPGGRPLPATGSPVGRGACASFLRIRGGILVQLEDDCTAGTHGTVRWEANGKIIGDIPVRINTAPV